MNVEDWIIDGQVSPEAIRDIWNTYQLTPSRLQALADEAGIDDLDGFDFRIQRETLRAGDCFYEQCTFAWEINKVQKYKTILYTKRIFYSV